ncbi:adenosine kinase [Enterovirga rhinocerotis]|uniref:Sugar/nucleoside kinase (Ribokinase family) n=1 Tax=Enterovirga rhinocerotis TaxID=1339210 RepID=A0A4R7BQY2_9HYPH|nr:adenosine kinase [Enterovirga rhinocerotis]TDR87172.1 sugar/nucleoside kinase (ribokinase family) [Enterovirga rhinocerotis]
MTDTGLDILAIGNAIVDILSQTDDRFLVEQALAKGTMALIDEARAEALYGLTGPATIVSGGSAANTAVGAVMLGAKTGYIGKVRDDELGGLFTHDMKAVGIEFGTKPASEGPATARCFVLVTPDGERTMNTYLGACTGLGPADIDAQTVASASIVYIEGYLWDAPDAKAAIREAIRVAHAAGNRTALTLSDPFCVDRYRDEFRGLLKDGSLDILFANSHELLSLYQTADLEAALAAFREEKALGVVTRSAEGALVVTRESTEAVPAFPVERVVDTTGAGDLFAAGFLAGLAKGLDGRGAARLGGLAAAEVISHIGARPQQDIAELARREGLLG